MSVKDFLRAPFSIPYALFPVRHFLFAMNQQPMRHVICLVLALTAIIFPSLASAAVSESVLEFQSMATLKEDRALTVTERILYEVAKNERHGIYRNIPMRYERDGGAYKLRLDVQDVKIDGVDVPYRILSRSPVLEIRIGDPDETVSGVHEYKITYETDRAINFFDGEGELYWNVTGDEWDVPILKSSFSIVAPANFDANASKAMCW
jgi:hypothetical protein